jgi:hypothetical protein
VPELQEMPDLIRVGLTELDNLTIQYCNQLQSLPRGLSKLGALKQLTLGGLHELQEMPDLIGLTALDSLRLQCVASLRCCRGDSASGGTQAAHGSVFG